LFLMSEVPLYDTVVVRSAAQRLCFSNHASRTRAGSEGRKGLWGTLEMALRVNKSKGNPKRVLLKLTNTDIVTENCPLTR